ncbi:MAG TPA: NADH-quinone oxidoreductase subunit C [Acidimicrobiales bacterium]
MSDQPAADGSAEEVPPESEGPPTIHGCPSSLSRGQLVVHVDRASYLGVVSALRDDGYQMCVDLTGVDYLVHSGRTLPAGVKPERFEVVVNLLSMSPPRRVRVRVQVPESDPTIPSLYQLHPGTDLMERETYDMFGIVFTGHPDLERLLMPDDWEGHPLRKDYGVGRIPVQFKGAPQPR